jgi:hypothetical protein
MSPSFEAFLARLYVDAAARRQFLDDPRAAAAAAGLSESECDALTRIDRDGLELAAESLARKRQHSTARPPDDMRQRLLRWWGTATRRRA